MNDDWKPAKRVKINIIFKILYVVTLKLTSSLFQKYFNLFELKNIKCILFVFNVMDQRKHSVRI